MTPTSPASGPRHTSSVRSSVDGVGTDQRAGLMVKDFPVRVDVELRGRRSECQALDRLIDACRSQYSWQLSQSIWHATDCSPILSTAVVALPH
jgi:hypothetical protein